MPRKHLFSIPFLLAISVAPLAFSRNVFVLPSSGGTVLPFVGDPFGPAPSSGIPAGQDTFIALSTPSGNKFYFVSRSATNTVVATDQNFNVVAQRSLGTGATAAVVSPDGRYLIVIAGNVQVIRTSDDQVQTQFSGGTSPNDLAVSRDGQRLYVTSSTGTLTAFDLNSFGVVGNLQLTGGVSGVGVGPNGLIYVAATNILYEIDPANLTLRGGQGISLNAQPGKPIFVPDLFGNLRVVMANTNPGFGGSSLVSVDLGTRQFTPLLTGGVVFDKVVPVSGNRVFATSTTGTLYDITLPSSVTQASFTGLGTLTNVKSIAASNEFPNARYLFIAQTGTNQITRVDLAAGAVSGQASLNNNPPGNVVWAGPAITNGTPASVYLFNNGQFMNPSTQSLPLVVRVVDSSNRPLTGVTVQFTTSAFGAQVLNPSVTTDVDGYAQTVVISPSVTGPFQVSVLAGGVSGVFNLSVGTGTGGTTGAISARSGNGQVIRENSVTPEPLKVIVRDVSGNPVPNATVNWAVTTLNGPNGSLAFQTTLTDFNGESTNTYISSFLGPSLLSSYVQSTIVASTFSGSVNMYVTVIPQLFGQQPASGPVVQLLAPLNTEQITAQAGTTLTGAIQVRVTAGSGPSVGSVIPNVGIQATTGLDATLAPSVRCADNSGLTDQSGVATCDLLIGSKIGEGDITISAGGQTAATLHLLVTPGLPGKINVVQGDGQAGTPGQTLPLALVGTIQDSFGNSLANVGVQWAIDSGSATLVNSINRSDTNARVSTLVQLGNTPGPVRVKVTALGGLTTATATFNLTINTTATAIQRVSGEGQTATVNSTFASPLVAVVLDPNGNAVPGIPVTFQISGPATLTSQSATSDSAGRVSVNVNAGATAGGVTVTANFGGVSVTWSLTVAPPGPAFSADTITNVAGGQTGIAPGSLVTIRGTGLVPSVRGTVFPALLVGPYPTTLGGVSVSFGSTPAPIFWVTNDTSGEAVTVQVPYEVPEGQTVPVTVNSGGNSSTVNVPIARVAPGIFETTDSSGRKYAVVARADGTFVTPDNPIARGEQARVFVSGLGRVTGAATNTPGGGQAVTGNVIVGINDAGVRVISSRLAQNLIGVYEVTFEVPADATTGSARNFAVAIDPGTGVVYSNGSTIAIR